MRASQTVNGRPGPGDVAAEIDDRMTAGGPTGEVEIRIVRPLGVVDTLPIVLHCHGGGWILGDKDTHERLDRELANDA